MSEDLYQTRYILHQAADGATIRFEPSTGKAWVLATIERGQYKYGVKQVEERQFFWKPILDKVADTPPAPEEKPS